MICSILLIFRFSCAIATFVQKRVTIPIQAHINEIGTPLALSKMPKSIDLQTGEEITLSTKDIEREKVNRK